MVIDNPHLSQFNSHSPVIRSTKVLGQLEENISRRMKNQCLQDEGVDCVIPSHESICVGL